MGIWAVKPFGDYVRHRSCGFDAMTDELKKGRKRIMFWTNAHGEWEYCPEMPKEENYHIPAAKELYAIIKQEEQMPSVSLRRSQWEA